MDKLKIKCDNCDWKIEDYVPKWYNKQCPKCNDCTVVNDDDMTVYNDTQTLIDLGVATRDMSRGGLKVIIDTASLRD